MMDLQEEEEIGDEGMEENVDFEDESTAVDEDGEDGMLNDQRAEAILGLENLTILFLSQLAELLGEGESRKKKITIQLVDRNKAAKDDGTQHMKSMQFPRGSLGGPSIRPLAQLFCVARCAHEALITGIPMTKRDIFYRDVSLFKNQAVVDTLVDDLAATLSLNRSDLNIRASSKGLICGSGLTVHLNEGESVVGHDAEASLIPTGEDIARFELSEDTRWILIVEKDAVFQTLRSSRLTCHPSLFGPGLLITGKGYPDVATRQLIKTFSDNLPETTPILVLVDADAYGIDIASVYKYGSTRMRHENEGLAASRVEWIGVSASEALTTGVDRDALLPITIHDQRKAISMLRSNKNLPKQWRMELMQMLHTRRKAEIEVLACSPSPRHLGLDDDKTYRVQTPSGSIRSTESPLIQYLITKINDSLDP